jgi:hypothetical protein
VAVAYGVIRRKKLVMPIAYGNPGTGYTSREQQRIYTPPPPKKPKKSVFLKDPETVKYGKGAGTGCALPKARQIKVDGVTYLSASQAARETKIHKSTLVTHANNGKPFQDHIIEWITPKKLKGRPRKAFRPIIVDGVEYRSVKDAARETHHSEYTLRTYANLGREFHGHKIEWKESA